MKIPAQAKSVFKGEIFEVFQWPQPLFDGSEATFEMLKRANTSQVIATRNGRIIIIEEEQPGKKYTGLFGGRQEVHETPLQAAQRELVEEGGFTSADWELLTTYEPLGKINWEINIFIARNVTANSTQKLDPGEKISFREVSFEEFLEMIFENNQDFGQFAFDLLYWKFLQPEKLAEFKQKLGLV